METYNYNAIIEELVADLKERVEEGCDVYDAAAEMIDGSQYVIYTRHHYKILDLCRANPTDVVNEFGIDFSKGFTTAIAHTVFGCLYRDVINEFLDSAVE